MPEASEVVRFYEDNFFQHFLIRYGIESDYKWLINPKVALLQAYDEATGSDLVLCLKTLIECCGDKKATAKQLGIHYNTLLYRITRMKEIADFDISHMLSAFGSELFHILLSVKLLTDAKF